MRSVWIMNLKDNRDDGEQKNTDKKFNFCQEHNILAIGWAGQSPADGSTAFKNALDGLSRMARGDLVWVKNPCTGERYLCEILNDRVLPLPNSFHAFDAARGRICEYRPVSEQQLCGKIDPKHLVSISTVRPVAELSVIQATNELFDRICACMDVECREEEISS